MSLERSKVLKGAICACCVLSWLLVVIAACVESWTVVAGSTLTTGPLGAVKIEQTVGVFQTYMTECCTVAGAVVGDFGSVCPSDTASSAACTSDKFRTADYCSYTQKKLSAVGRGLPMDCNQVEAGSIAAVVCALFPVVVTVFIVPMLIRSKINFGPFAIASIVSLILLIVILAVFHLMCFQNVEKFILQRYSEYQSPSNAFTVKLGSSYDLIIAAFVFQLFAVICCVVAWQLERKSDPAPVVRSVSPVDPVIPVMTPRRSPPRDRSILVDRSLADADVLPLCPMDADCAFATNFGHQLEYAHTCRDPFCNDTSDAHLRHFRHAHHEVSAIQQYNGPIWLHSARTRTL